MRTGYPRFFIHLTIQELEKEVLLRYGTSSEGVMLFPSPATAMRCQRFFYDKQPSVKLEEIRILNLVSARHHKSASHDSQTSTSGLSCVFFPKQDSSIAKQVWQHTGDGISSRRGEFCLKALQDGLLYPECEDNAPRDESQNFIKGPRRYQRDSSSRNITNGFGQQAGLPPNHTSDAVPEGNECSQFVEERFGRNLNAKLAGKAKLAIRRRISGCLTDDSTLDHALGARHEECPTRVKGLSEEDVYLYPTGMSSIFNTHRILMANRAVPCKSICFGFPYVDTLKILQKWGAGCLFYGKGRDSDLDDLERRLEQGERYLALFTEVPSNPLLKSADLKRIRRLADRYDFAVVVDESVGNFINVNVLSQADVVVSSLTKVFSGDSNVMGGSTVLNPQGSMYQSLKRAMTEDYEDNYWAEDAVFMERNSRDFVSRIQRINTNAEAIADALHSSPSVRQVYYPKYSQSSRNYDSCRNAHGGYGGLLSLTLKEVEQAVAFFDSLEVQKGPSLGTNFTLACPYTILAHYSELDWAASFGVEADLIRISVGLEDKKELLDKVKRALKVAEQEKLK